MRKQFYLIDAYSGEFCGYSTIESLANYFNCPKSDIYKWMKQDWSICNHDDLEGRVYKIRYGIYTPNYNENKTVEKKEINPLF